MGGRAAKVMAAGVTAALLVGVGGAPALATVEFPVVPIPGDDVSGDAGGTGTPGLGTSTGEPDGGQVAFTDIRVGRDGDVERVVWEFGGPGLPGWRAEFTDDPTQDGSGASIPLSGDAAISVVITGVGIPDDVELPPGVTPYDQPPQLLSPASTRVITEVYPGATFEGQQDGAVGLERQAPFRVYRLENPTRIVLEVVDEAATGAPTGIPAGDGSSDWRGPLAWPAAIVLVLAGLVGAAVWAAVRRERAV